MVDVLPLLRDVTFGYNCIERNKASHLVHIIPKNNVIVCLNMKFKERILSIIMQANAKKVSKRLPHFLSILIAFMLQLVFTVNSHSLCNDRYLFTHPPSTFLEYVYAISFIGIR